MYVYESYSEKETMDFAFKFANQVLPGQIICLNGDLGVGKTIFTKGFASGLSIDEYVTSPTFTIINEYQGRLPLYHFDVYRISSKEEMDDTGFEDYFFGKGVCLVEWAELIQELIPETATWITLEKDYSKGDDYRKITVS